MGLSVNVVSGSSPQVFPAGVVVPIAVALVAGLIAGYLAANYASPQGEVFTKLSSEDKNFLVQIANAQVELTTTLTAQQSALVDWCTAAGGLWLTQQSQNQIPVNAQQAQQLQQQGAQVVQQQDGSIVATVMLLDRSSCVVVPTRGG